MSKKFLIVILVAVFLLGIAVSLVTGLGFMDKKKVELSISCDKHTYIYDPPNPIRVECELTVPEKYDSIDVYPDFEDINTVHDYVYDKDIGWDHTVCENDNCTKNHTESRKGKVLKDLYIVDKTKKYYLFDIYQLNNVSYLEDNSTKYKVVEDSVYSKKMINDTQIKIKNRDFTSEKIVMYFTPESSYGKFNMTMDVVIDGKTYTYILDPFWSTVIEDPADGQRYVKGASYILGMNWETESNTSAITQVIHEFDGANTTLWDDQDSLVGYWKFDDSAPNQTGDSSGNANHGILGTGVLGDGAEPSYVSGYQSNALEFDGSDDYVDIGNDTSLKMTTGDFSVSMWFYPKESSQQVLIGNDQNTANGGWALFMFTSNRVLLYNQQVTKTVPTNSVNLNEWNHLVFVFNDDTNSGNFYLNNVAHSFSGAGEVNESTKNMVMGVDPRDKSGNEFNGTIDEVKIWNRSLSASEISDLYNMSKHQFNNTQNDLASATYTWKQYAKDTDGNWNTSSQTYTVNKAIPMVTISNGTQSINTSSLVGYWRFTNTTDDMSGNDNDGSINGYTVNDGSLENGVALTSSGKYGMGYSFDGSDDVISTSYSNNLSVSDHTYSFWIKTQGGNSKAVFGSSSSADFMYYIAANRDASQIEYKNSTGSVIYSGLCWDNFDDVWVHVAIVSNSTGFNVYTDGTSCLDVAYSGGRSLGSQTINIGKAYAYPFNGTIDEVRIWNVALTADEITAEKDSRYPVKTQGLVSSWSFENNNATHTKDTNNLVSSRFGGAGYFDSNNQWVEITPTGNVNITGDEITVNAWFKVDDIGIIRPIASHATSNNGLKWEIYRHSNNKVLFGARNSTHTGQSYTDNTINSGQWYMITFVYNGTLQYGYLDAQLQADDYAMVGNLKAEPSSIWIGRLGTYANEFNGTIDEVSIWNRSLTADEIRLLYETSHHYYDTGQYNVSDDCSETGNPSLEANLTSVSNPSTFLFDNWNEYGWFTGYFSGTENYTEVHGPIMPFKVDRDGYYVLQEGSNTVHYLNDTTTIVNSSVPITVGTISEPGENQFEVHIVNTGDHNLTVDLINITSVETGMSVSSVQYKNNSASSYTTLAVSEYMYDPVGFIEIYNQSVEIASDSNIFLINFTSSGGDSGSGGGGSSLPFDLHSIVDENSEYDPDKKYYLFDNEDSFNKFLLIASLALIVYFLFRTGKKSRYKHYALLFLVFFLV